MSEEATSKNRQPVEVIPIAGLPEFAPGDDLAEILARGAKGMLRDGDVVVVTQKIVSKVEGRLVRDSDRAAVAESESVAVLARRDDMVISRTKHGLVCANAGVDASNVPSGMLTLLPEDPDASAAAIRESLLGATGAERIGVVITDTFGRAWRKGLVNIAIGCAGLPSLIDLRGTKDQNGRLLEASVVALADEVAAASGLVVAKDSRVPVVVVRGLDAFESESFSPASEIVRPRDEDLFAESPLMSISSRRTIRSFGPGEVDTQTLERAFAAACTAPAPHHTRPWFFTALQSMAAKNRLMEAMEVAWRADLERDGVALDVIDRRIAKSRALLSSAAVLIVPWITFRGAHHYPDDERASAERDMFLLSGGAAIQSLLLALHDQSVGSCWISSTLFCKEETRSALGVSDEWHALGIVAAGPMPKAGANRPRPAIDLSEFVRFSD